MQNLVFCDPGHKKDPRLEYFGSGYRLVKAGAILLLHGVQPSRPAWPGESL